MSFPIRYVKKCKKDHICDFCQNVIKRGSSYIITTTEMDGGFRTFKECEICRAFIIDYYGEIFENNGEMIYELLTEHEDYEQFRVHYSTAHNSENLKKLYKLIEKAKKERSLICFRISKMEILPSVFKEHIDEGMLIEDIKDLYLRPAEERIKQNRQSLVKPEILEFFEQKVEAEFNSQNNDCKFKGRS